MSVAIISIEILMSIEEVASNSDVDFPRFRGHTEKFDIISNMEVLDGRSADI